MLANGRYLLLEPVGEDRMARIWRARDEVMEREVAVKELLLPPQLAADDRAELLALTVREARAAGRIDHPSVITIYDLAEDSGIAWIVTQFVRGPSLGAEINRAGRLPWQRAGEIGEQVAGGLAEAHAAGMVHRDLTPDSILLAGQRAIVTNFGLATIAEARAKLAGTETITGTPGYMAPEQFDGRPTGPATDMWALGATLYCATEGRPPFDGSTLGATIGAIVAKPHDPPQHAGPLAGLIGSLLDKDPARRPDASAAAGALAAHRAATEAVSQVAAGSRGEESAGAIPGAPPDVAAPFGWPAKPPGATAGSPQDAIAPFGWAPGPEQGMATGLRRRAMPRPGKAWPVVVAGISTAAAIIAVVALLESTSSPGRPSYAGATASLGATAGLRATAGLPAAASSGSRASTPAATTSPTPSATRSHPASTGPECSFVVDGPGSCGSTNPRVRLSVNFGNDTSGCSWVRNITWGDGTSSDGVTVQGGPAGPKYVTAHTYSRPGSYTIYFGGEVTQGACNIVTPTFQFTFRKP